MSAKTLTDNIRQTKTGMEGVQETSFDIPMLDKVSPIVNRGVIGAPVKLDYKNRVGSLNGIITDIWFFDNRNDPHVNKFRLRTNGIPGEEFATISNVDGVLKIDSLHGDEFSDMHIPEYTPEEFIDVPEKVAGWELLFKSPWGAMWCSPQVVKKETEYRTLKEFETVSIVKLENEWVCIPTSRTTTSFKPKTFGWHTFSDEDILPYAVSRMESKPQNESFQWFNYDSEKWKQMDSKHKRLSQYNF